MDPLEASVTVDLPPERAFELFTEGLGEWWPREFSWSQEALEELGIEAHEGAFAYERGHHGFTFHWGRVITCEAPQRDRVHLASAGPLTAAQPGPVERGGVLFTGAPEGGTDVALEHRGWERHSEGAREYRDGFETAAAWPQALDSFAATAAVQRPS